MIALLQRVRQAHVDVDNVTIAQIKQGLLVFIGVEQHDSERQADRLLDRLLKYRIFADQNDKMNFSLQDIEGGLLLVPQFTLTADTNEGLRPSFSHAAPPNDAHTFFDYICSQAIQKHQHVATGQFAADMQVSLTNDGPATFWLQIPPKPKG
mgnify:CR=1 FL=1